MDTLKPSREELNTIYGMKNNKKYVTSLGIDPKSTDDTAFGDEVYCSQHVRVHSTGWCTVLNGAKQPA